MENAASRFGQRLAHTEKKYRDLALKKLTVYLTKKAEWTDLEWDKLWKALFYCMWMSDKRPIQEELSSNLASLVHKLPSVELALGFVHSFFRTMHREWHGIDGLRLDKFYSLVRKFVHESIALLQNNDWEHEEVQTFVSILSSEIISQLPNGLRMHLSDLYLEEIYKAVGASVDTEAFLLLLEPFFTLLSSEYDKTIFKRVRELVFAPMLTDYKFGPQPEKKQNKKSTESNESGETDGDDEEEDEEDKVFELVDLAYVQHRIFNIASADDTAERNRSGLYDLYSKFFQVTKVDSLKAIQEDASKPKTSPKKTKTADKKQPESVSAKAAVVPETDASADSKKKKKNKKRKKSQTDTDPEAEVPKAVVTPPVVTEEPKKSPQKKQKVAEVKAVEPVAVVAADKKQKKNKKTVEQEDVAVKSPAKDEEKASKKVKKDAVVVAEPEKKKLKEDKPTKKEALKKSEPEAEVKAKKEVVKEPELSKKEAKKKAKAEKANKAKAEKQTEKSKAPAKQVVVKSGMKFQRCAVCKGFGKGFLPAGKDMCAHCERTQKVQKKAAAVVAKKRKASEVAASSQAAEAEAANAKKVTFGKNKALPHELSVKRLKASAKKEATPKEGIKGVLKTTPSPPAAKTTKKVSSGKGRMKAADFF
ncbi:hypothetical protein Gpo141_00008566 [Globisporangium polare]